MSSAAPLVLAIVNSPVLRAALSDGSRSQADFDIRLLTIDHGVGEEAVAQVADLNPALVVVELDGPAAWLSHVRSDPATRRIPVIAIGSSPDAEARAAGVKVRAFFTPEAFIAALPAPLHDHARIYDKFDALRDQCSAPPPLLVLQGLREFNAGEYYECHETLEHAWMAETGPARELYRAILQVSVAYYQIIRGNYNGARKMFLRSVQWFAPLPDQCQGIDVAGLRADVAAVRAHLEALGPERIAAFDRSLLKPIRYQG